MLPVLVNPIRDKRIRTRFVQAVEPDGISETHVTMNCSYRAKFFLVNVHDIRSKKNECLAKMKVVLWCVAIPLSQTERSLVTTKPRIVLHQPCLEYLPVSNIRKIQDFQRKKTHRILAFFPRKYWAHSRYCNTQRLWKGHHSCPRCSILLASRGYPWAL